MNLKTHTAYAEVNITPYNVFTVKIIDSKGKIKFEDMGAGKTNEEARTKANTMIESKSSEYLRG
mgnify:CR=1 FL=1